MKIIGGTYKGREIKGPHSKSVRPTLAKVREAFFDIIADKVKDAYFLDLYAGTGAMGIEAISRGAKKVYFIEHSRPIATLLSKNLAFIDSNLYVIIRMDIMNALEYIEFNGPRFDIAYIDPPYTDRTAYTEVLMDILERKIMNDEFTIGVEHNRNTVNLLQQVSYDLLVKPYKYGDTYLTVLRRIKNG